MDGWLPPLGPHWRHQRANGFGGEQKMYRTGNDGYLIRERNAELLREVGVTRLERRLRSNKRPRTGARGLRTQLTTSSTE